MPATCRSTIDTHAKKLCRVPLVLHRTSESLNLHFLSVFPDDWFISVTFFSALVTVMNCDSVTFMLDLLALVLHFYFLHTCLIWG